MYSGEAGMWSGHEGLQEALTGSWSAEREGLPKRGGHSSLGVLTLPTSRESQEKTINLPEAPSHYWLAALCSSMAVLQHGQRSEVECTVHIWDWTKAQGSESTLATAALPHLYPGYLYRMMMPTLITMETNLHVNRALMEPPLQHINCLSVGSILHKKVSFLTGAHWLSRGLLQLLTLLLLTLWLIVEENSPFPPRCCVGLASVWQS